MPEFEQYHENDDEKSLLLKNLRPRHKSTIEGLCREEKCSPLELSILLVEKVDEILQYCKEHHSVTDDELNDKIDFLYQCYISTRNISSAENLTDFANSLDSFESFTSQYAKAVSKETLANFVLRVNRFIYTVVHPNRIISPEEISYYNELGVYNTEGRWLSLPLKFSWADKEYVEKSVVEEIINLQKVGYKKPDLFHGTSSSALKGIAKHQAILSASKALKLGEAIQSGEHIPYVTHDGHSVSGGEKGLGSIHAATYLNENYCLAKWFNENHVVFGFSEKKINERLHKTRLGLSAHEMLIGSEVPLELVDIIYSENINLNKLRSWATVHAPHAQVVSFEADELLSRNQVDKNRYLSEEKEMIDWESLLKQKPIVIT